MLGKIKKAIPDSAKVYINKIIFPIKYIKYLLNKNKYKNICKKFNLKFYTDVESVNQIVYNKKSLARFGDGEFLWLLKIDSGSYQKASDELAEKLEETLKSKNENLLIGLPETLNVEYLQQYKIKNKIHWTNFGVKHFNKIEPLIDKNKTYANTQMSRFYIDFKNNGFANEKIDNIKRIWNNRDIVIVEGEKTKMGIGNDLYANAKSIKRIICPAKNAFDKYDEIFENIKKYGKNKLIILALGPTATILAKDIANLNDKEIEYQAIDLGHLDIEYQWFLMRAKNKEAIKGKFVNEVRNRDLSNESIENEEESEYKKQIIITIK